MVAQANLSEHILVDSAGTSAWHLNEPPDRRATAKAQERGVDLSKQRARQALTTDFAKFDYILPMDDDNLQELRRLAPSNYGGCLGLFLEYSQQAQYREVPDPYNGGEDGFALVLDLVEDASAGLLKHIRQHHL